MRAEWKVAQLLYVELRPVLSVLNLKLRRGQIQDAKSSEAATHQLLEGGRARQRVQQRERLVGDPPQLGPVRREARDVRQRLLKREKAENGFVTRCCLKKPKAAI